MDFYKKIRHLYEINLLWIIKDTEIYLNLKILMPAKLESTALDKTIYLKHNSITYGFRFDMFILNTNCKKVV